MNEQRIFRHYKGGLYTVLHEALHTETKEVCLVYVQMATHRVFVRPKDNFLATVEKDGQRVPRFAPVPDAALEAARQRAAQTVAQRTNLTSAEEKKQAILQLVVKAFE